MWTCGQPVRGLERVAAIMSYDMRPPINRAMRTLDRGFFLQKFSISAARVFDNKDLSSCRSILQKNKDALRMERLSLIRPDPELNLAQQGKKCLLLRSELRHDGRRPSTQDT